MAASGRQLNWTNVAFTPEGGTAIPLLGVTSVTIDHQGKSIAGAGDGDTGPSSRNLTDEDPLITIELERIMTLSGLALGTRGTFTATHMDADNGAGAGALIYAVAHCMVRNVSKVGRFRTYGTGTLVIETWSPDGRTSPVSTTIAA
jgi:hypothetical protein